LSFIPKWETLCQKKNYRDVNISIQMMPPVFKSFKEKSDILVGVSQQLLEQATADVWN